MRPDHAGVADVDRAVRRLHVQPDPEAHQEHRRGSEHPDRPHRPGGLRTTAPADPDEPSDQVDQRRVHERRAPEDLPAVEEPQGHAEGEQREQIEVPHAQRPPEVGQAQQEDRAEGQPDGRRVDLLAAEGSLSPPRHLPGHLRPGPRLGDGAGDVVDRSECDLPGVAGPDLHRPFARVAVEVGVGDRLRRVPLEPVRDLGVLAQDRHRPLLRQPLLGRRGERGGRHHEGAHSRREKPEHGAQASAGTTRASPWGNPWFPHEPPPSTAGAVSAGTTRACCPRS